MSLHFSTTWFQQVIKGGQTKANYFKGGVISKDPEGFIQSTTVIANISKMVHQTTTTTRKKEKEKEKESNFKSKEVGQR